MRKLSEWIDLLEGELPEVVAAELELLLRHSVNDRRAFLNIAHLKDIIKKSDPINNEKELILNKGYNEKLTGKIMAKIKRAHRTSSTKVSKQDNLLKLEMGSVS